MISPGDVAAFHRDYDNHTDHRIGFFGALTELVPP
ncbi:MAG: hypothetical protein ACI81L_002783 [Verrucomicrobiales bacterium]|jgi:hypothetical protein